MRSLIELLPPGATVCTVLKHVSASGMQRAIQPLVMENGECIRDITHLIVATKLFKQSKKHGGLVLNGCGMDMGFELVYVLGRHLYSDGFGVLSTTAQYGDHASAVRPRNRAEAATLCAGGYKFCGRNGDTTGWDTDGGYALKQRWL